MANFISLLEEFVEGTGPIISCRGRGGGGREEGRKEGWEMNQNDFPRPMNFVVFLAEN